MKKILLLAAAVLSLAAVATVFSADRVIFGDNPSAGGFTPVNGIRIYHESYGEGRPLLVIHGNGGSIADVSGPIAFFSHHGCRVLAADSRGHGKSDAGPGRLTYEQQADDLSELLRQLKVGKTLVLGFSDGGILGLLLAIRHPEQIEKLAFSGANLNPEGAQPWALAWARQSAASIDERIAAHDRSRDWTREKNFFDLLINQPHISHDQLHTIQIPVLVMAGDRDIIRAEHTQEIFDQLPHAHLCIFPGSTHLVLRDAPDAVNQVVENFFAAPFERPESRDLLR